MHTKHWQWLAAAWGVCFFGLLGIAGINAFRSRGCELSEGRVYYRGKPVTTGVVVAIGADGQPHQAPINGDGTYTLGSVPRGTANLAVISRDPAMAQTKRQRMTMRDSRLTTQDLAPANTEKRAWLALPRQVEDPSTSGLQIRIQSSEKFDIQIP